MSTETTARGTVLLVLSKVLFLLGTILVHVFLGRTLGPEGYGQYGLVMSILLWFEVVVSSTVPWAVSKVISEKKISARSAFSQGMRLQLVISLALLVVFVILAPTLAHLFGDRTVKILLWWAALDIPFFALWSVLLSYYNGLQRFGRQGLISISRIFFKVIATVLFVLSGYSVRGALVGNILGSALAVVAGLFVLRLAPKSQDRFRLTDRVLSFGVPFTLYLFCTQLLLSVDLWSVKIFIKETSATGFYTAVQTITRVPYFLFLGLSTALFPALSHSTSSGQDQVSRIQVRQAMRLLILVLLPSAAIVASSSRQIIDLLFSSQFAPAVVPLTILMWGMILFTIFYNMAVIVAVSGRPYTAVSYSALLIAADVVFNWLLIPRLGLRGAALATTLTGFLGVVILGTLVYRQFQVFLWSWSIVKMLAVGAVIFVASWLVPLEGFLLVAKCVILFALFQGGMVLVGELGKEDYRRLRDLIPSLK
jgi:O-antigen/teichoic acid export membrane protein